MKWPVGLHARLRAVAGTIFPSLRVIGMAYTGLIGVGAAALVVSVAFLPVPPVLQEATAPAREAVANLVQPATDVVTSLINTLPTPHEPRFRFMPAPQVELASPPTSPDPVAEDATVPSADAQPLAARIAAAPSTPLTYAPVAKASVSRDGGVEASTPVAEDIAVDEPRQAVDAPPREPVREVTRVPVAPVQQEANIEAPQPLPPLLSPTEAPWQAKARQDVENQVAIDAAKASVVRRKTQADTANQAAIDVRKATTVNVTATPTGIETADTARPFVATAQATTPAAPVVPTATPPTLASPNARSNQTLIDAARASKVRARADANAANQAAIDAARAPHSTVTPTPSPTLRQVPSTPTPPPSPTAEPTPTNSFALATDVVSVDVLNDQPMDLEEMPISLALDAPQD